MKVYTKLDCVVREQQSTSAKVKTATEIAIFLGPQLVATKVAGGRYTEQQGLLEFQRNPHSFQIREGMEAAIRLAA